VWLCAFAGIVLSTPLCAGERTSSTTSYWYGGELHPLVVTRDGVNYRLMGKQVMEMAGAGDSTRIYAHADRLGSVRVTTNDTGEVVQSLSYEEYGSTHIAGKGSAAADESMASFYRFEGQEQEVFPLAKLGIEDEALASWLDRIDLYHFPWRHYAAGLTTFIETDPVPTEDSLYAALGANPVNITDETGGMMNNVPFVPAHANVSPQMQMLLDRLLNEPSANFEFDDIIALSELRLAVVRQRYMMNNNPFAPRGRMLGKRNPAVFYGQMDVTEQRRRDAQAAFRILHQEQDNWLRTYSRPIGALWDRLNASLGRNLFGEQKTDAEEEENGSDSKANEEKDDGQASDASPPLATVAAPEPSPAPPNPFADEHSADEQQENENGREPLPSPNLPAAHEQQQPEPHVEPRGGRCCSIL
jgi:hypothetical protein